MNTTKVVAIGGGHGLAATLRTLRKLTGHLTAVVSVADNGGSTGRLREKVSLPAPGDLRKCLVSMSNPDSLIVRSLEHRFQGGDLDGHALGNLLIAAMLDESGDLVEALDELGRLIGVEGRVLPATTSPVNLVGRTSDGTSIRGQVEVMGTADLASVTVEPVSAQAAPEAVDAIMEADVLVMGPGSLFTSVLAALVVPGIREAVRDSEARTTYICNLRPQEGETAGFTGPDHVRALARHGVVPDVMIYDPTYLGEFPADALPEGLDVRCSTLADETGYTHDAERLAKALRDVIS